MFVEAGNIVSRQVSQVGVYALVHRENDKEEDNVDHVMALHRFDAVDWLQQPHLLTSFNKSIIIWRCKTSLNLKYYRIL